MVNTMALRRGAAGLTLAATLGGVGIAAASPASATVTTATKSAPTVAVPSAVGSCRTWYDCTVYFSKSETRALGSWGRAPAVPPYLPWQIKGAYYGGVYGLKWFANQYANRGWCSAYRVTAVPWASQGYYGYGCSWN